MTRTQRLLRSAVLVVGLVLTPALTACGDDEEPSGGSSSGDHNAADVTFATEMIQHHAQALVMVDLTVGRELDPEFQRLTEAIRDAQAPEIEVMADWLVGWGEEVPATDRDHVNAENGDEDTNGDLTELEAAQGDEFRTLWLEQMIEHHEGAIAMAETEQADGDYPAAVDLAESIIEAQSAEIDTMEEMLGS